MLLSLVTFDKDVLDHGMIPEPVPCDGLVLCVYVFGKSLSLCKVIDRRLNTKTYLKVPFGAIKNKYLF